MSETPARWILRQSFPPDCFLCVCLSAFARIRAGQFLQMHGPRTSRAKVDLGFPGLDVQCACSFAVLFAFSYNLIYILWGGKFVLI